HDLPRQRVTVGVQTGRGVADQLIAGRDAVAVQRLVFFDHAYDRTGEIVVSGLVEVRQLRRLPTGQRHGVRLTTACHAADDLLCDLRNEIAGRDVVEKGERCPPVDQDVVDAVIHQIFADGIVNPGQRGDQHFGAYAVRRHDQDRFLVPIRYPHHATEPTDGPARERRARRAHQLGDATLCLFGRVEL